MNVQGNEACMGKEWPGILTIIVFSLALFNFSFGWVFN
jgi:hypothetical protein